jgi:hypothetical protein
LVKRGPDSRCWNLISGFTPKDKLKNMFNFSACYFNVHKRCQKNVANNCGINARQLADILNDMGMTPHKLATKVQKPKKKVKKIAKQTKRNPPRLII